MAKPLFAVMLQEDEYQTYVVPRATFTFIPMNYQRRLQEVFNIIGGRAWPRRGRAGGEFNSIRGWSGRCPRLRGNFSSQCGLVGKTPRQCEEHRRLWQIPHGLTGDLFWRQRLRGRPPAAGGCQRERQRRLRPLGRPSLGVSAERNAAASGGQTALGAERSVASTDA